MAAKGTIIITGANGSLGSALVEQIASRPELSAYHGLYLVRDAAAAPTLSSILAGHSSLRGHEAVSLDLTDLDQVRQVAQDINDRVSSETIPPIRALILNAGFHDFGKQAWTRDGYDVTFVANYLGHWLLTLLLLKSMAKEDGRIVVIGSQSHDPHDPRNASSKAFVDEKYKQFISNDAASVEAVAKGTWSSAADDPSWRGGFRRYGASRLCLVMMIYELQRRLDDDASLKNISVLGVDPGTMSTGLTRHAPWSIRVFYFRIIYPILVRLFPNGDAKTPKRSGPDVIEAAFASDLGTHGGLPKALYFDGRQPLETSGEAKDLDKRGLVWRESIKYTRLSEGETILGNWQ